MALTTIWRNNKTVNRRGGRGDILREVGGKRKGGGAKLQQKRFWSKKIFGIEGGEAKRLGPLSLTLSRATLKKHSLVKPGGRSMGSRTRTHSENELDTIR